MELGSLLIFLGVFLIVTGFANSIGICQRRTWPEVVGVIQRNETVNTPKPPNYSGPPALPSKRTGRKFGDKSHTQELWLSYLYAVDGVKYVGSRLYSAPLIKLEAKKLSGINVGDKVKVFYCASNPSISFLAHSYQWASVISAVFGVALVIWGGIEVKFA